MPYTITDITELVHYHLVLSVDSDADADSNLAQLIGEIEQMITSPRPEEPVYWTACEECGAWVSSELFGPAGAGECDDGGFRCTECRFADQEGSGGCGCRERRPPSSGDHPVLVDEAAQTIGSS